jgi:hypothetical protein
MPLDNIVAVGLVMGVFGLVILIVLWPGERQGRRLLRRWGIDHPADQDVTEAVRYLKRRRFSYPWLFLVLPQLAALTGAHSSLRETDDAWWTIAWTVLLGGLLGELFALRPARAEHRQAMLTPRRVVDLVPAWALVLLGIATAGGLLRYGLGRQWPEFGVVVLCAAAASVIITLAVTRPAAGDPVVDLVLRARSARVATGLAIAVPAALPRSEWSALPALVFFVSLVAVIAVASPSPRVAAALK